MSELKTNQVAKKRGRKKKYESTPFRSHDIEETFDNSVVETQQKIDKDNYKTNNLKFGNIVIEVHDKESSETNISDFFIENTNEECKIVISSDEEDNCNTKTDNSKKVTLYNKDNRCNVKKQLKCFNCHHFFEAILSQF